MKKMMILIVGFFAMVFATSGGAEIHVTEQTFRDACLLKKPWEGLKKDDLCPGQATYFLLVSARVRLSPTGFSWLPDF